MLHRRRPAHVERGHQNFFLLPVGEAAGDFRGGGGFAGALQADHHDGDRRRGVKIDALAIGAERCDKLVVHDLHDHLAGRDRFHHLDADGLLLDVVGEGARHVERDVGFQQRAANLAQRRIDVGFAERAAAGEAVENAAEFFRQSVEQLFSLSKNGHPFGMAYAQNNFTPEGALRCRAVASGLSRTGRQTGISSLHRERAEPRVGVRSSQGV